MEQRNFIVSEQLLKAIAGYLIQRPYLEVKGLVSAIEQLQPVALNKEKSKINTTNKSNS